MLFVIDPTDPVRGETAVKVVQSPLGSGTQRTLGSKKTTSSGKTDWFKTNIILPTHMIGKEAEISKKKALVR
jgi:hypothetical protein